MSRIRQFVTTHLPLGLYSVVGLGLLLQGVRYLSSGELMPYHMAVIEIPWDSLERSQQTLFLGLLKGFGAGAFCVGFATLLLAFIPLRAGQRWARWVTPAVAGSYSAALVYVTQGALLPGATPIAVSVALCAMVVIAAVGSLFGSDSPSA